jgi:hypothetical protein
MGLEMARANKNDQQKNSNDSGANVGYESELWQMADALRGSVDAAEYKHVVLGLSSLNTFLTLAKSATLTCNVPLMILRMNTTSPPVF